MLIIEDKSILEQAKEAAGKWISIAVKNGSSSTPIDTEMNKKEIETARDHLREFSILAGKELRRTRVGKIKDKSVE